MGFLQPSLQELQASRQLSDGLLSRVGGKGIPQAAMRFTRSSSSYRAVPVGPSNLEPLRCPKRDRELDPLKGMIDWKRDGENGNAQAHGAQGTNPQIEAQKASLKD